VVSEVSEGVMNRRKFFKWLGAGVAVAAIAPTALLREDPSLSGWVAHDFISPSPFNEYGDYTNFSSFAISTAIDDSVSSAAQELSRSMATL
jgi:hypothetical protein